MATLHWALVVLGLMKLPIHVMETLTRHCQSLMFSKSKWPECITSCVSKPWNVLGLSVHIQIYSKSFKYWTCTACSNHSWAMSFNQMHKHSLTPDQYPMWAACSLCLAADLMTIAADRLTSWPWKHTWLWHGPRSVKHLDLNSNHIWLWSCHCCSMWWVPRWACPSVVSSTMCVCTSKLTHPHTLCIWRQARMMMSRQCGAAGKPSWWMVTSWASTHQWSMTSMSGIWHAGHVCVTPWCMVHALSHTGTWPDAPHIPIIFSWGCPRGGVQACGVPP